MKNRSSRLICPILILSLTAGGICGCSAKKDMQPPSAAADELPEQGKEETDSRNTENTSQSADVDLTVLSSTMVYSEVYNMMVSPEQYLGKTVKMNGLFSLYHDEAADKNYFSCIVQDATACCAQGIEFVLSDDYSYPEDYPEAGEEICVSGVFDTYQEDSNIYCTLRNAELL